MQRPNIMTVWMYILCHVVFVETDVIWKGERITLSPGQGLFRTTQMAKGCFISQPTVYRILLVLANEEQIAWMKSNKGSLITVKNWERYQSKSPEVNNRVNNNRITETQQGEYQVNNHSTDSNCVTSDSKNNGEYQMNNNRITSEYQVNNLPIIQRIKEFKELKELKKEKAEQKEKNKTATDAFSEIGKEAFDFWQQNLGLPSPLLATKIQDLAEDTGLSAFKRAIEIAIERNRKNFAYIKAVAKGIQENGEFDGRKGKDRIQHDADSDFVTRKMLESGNVF